MMSSQTVANTRFLPRRVSQDDATQDDHPRGSNAAEYLRFLAVAGALGMAALAAPLLAFAGTSLVVAGFGWILGGL